MRAPEDIEAKSRSKFLEDFSVSGQSGFFVGDTFYQHAPAVEEADFVGFVVEHQGELRL